MTTATRKVFATVGHGVVVADVDEDGNEPWDGETYAVEIEGECHGGGFTLSQAVAYATTRHNEALAERLYDAVAALKEEDPRTGARIEAAIAALKRKPTAE